MKLTGTTMTFAMTCLWSVAVFAQIALMPDAEPQRVFAGDAQGRSPCVWHNAGDQTAAAEIRARMFQTSSATAVQVGRNSRGKNCKCCRGKPCLNPRDWIFPP